MNKSIMKNIVRVIMIAILISMLMSNVLILTTNYSLARNIGGVNVNDRKSVNTTDLENTSAKVIGVIQVVGILIAVGVIMVIGIKYMMGSAEEKAEYKKTLMPYVIGAALIFAASMFAQVAYDFFNGWNADGTGAGSAVTGGSGSAQATQ